MTAASPSSSSARSAGHARFVRVSHWTTAVSVFTLAVTGVVILMVHPRLYWGEAGNDLMPALLELPISRNHQHGGWTSSTPLVGAAGGPVTATRTYDIFNENGWGRSLHFLAAWVLVFSGLAYAYLGLAGGHFRSHVWPAVADLAPRRVWRDLVDHTRLRMPPASGGPHYGVLQKLAYSLVVFLLAPLMVLTGLAMSPAVTAGYPVLLTVFGGFQSARTIHFVVFMVLVLFVAVHLAMVSFTGFSRQTRAMILGDRT